MPIIAPTPVASLLDPPNPSQTESEFDAAAYNWSADLTRWNGEVNGLAGNVHNNAIEAKSAADTATTRAAEVAANANTVADQAAEVAANADTVATTTATAIAKASEASDSAASAHDDALACAALVESIAGGPVASVNGKTGPNVTLEPADVGAQAAMSVATQAEMEAGTDPAVRSMSPLRVKQAIAALAGSNLVRSARTSNTPLVAADKGALIDITSGTFTQTFSAAAMLGAGWYCYVGNSGAGFVTLDPNASETITRDGVSHSMWVLWPKEICLIVCDGAGFYYTNLQKGVIDQTISSLVTGVHFTTGLAYRGPMLLSAQNISKDSTSGVTIMLNNSTGNYQSGIEVVGSSGGINSASSFGNAIEVANSCVANASINERIQFEAIVSPGVVKTTVTATSSYVPINGSGSAGNYKSMVAPYSCTAASISSISVVSNSGNFVTGRVTLKEL